MDGHHGRQRVSVIELGLLVVILVVVVADFTVNLRALRQVGSVRVQVSKPPPPPQHGPPFGRVT